MSRWILTAFPNLTPETYRITSLPTRVYNCIAWAAEDTTEWWYPDPDGRCYWTPNTPRTETLEAFLDAFKTLGYTPCDNGELEAGYLKVALYAKDNGYPTHAARQLSSGKWTSKLGKGEDIEHDTPDGVEGAIYGTVAQYMKRPTV